MIYQYPGGRRPLKPRIHTVDGKWRVSFPGVSSFIVVRTWPVACEIVRRYYECLAFLDLRTFKDYSIAQTFLGYK